VEPLKITAELYGRVLLPREGVIHLDALLMAAVARVEMLPLVLDEERMAEIPIPVAKSECGRYYLASASVQKVQKHESRWINKRFPIAEWQQLGGGKSAQRVQLSAGPSKNFRLPAEAHHIEGQRLTWWCVGDRERITYLLGAITSVGRLRGHGEGEVRSWTVEPCEPWEGFPVLSPDGAALRTLPLDTPRLGEHVPRFGNLAPPYWRRSTEEPVAAPVPR
jgi:CRISPR type IV-associated protein Csf3